MTPEGKVKDKVKLTLAVMGAYYCMPATGGYGSSGIPDVLCCYKGRFIGIECKTRGNKPTRLQQSNLDEIERQGGMAFVINEDNSDSAQFDNCVELLALGGREVRIRSLNPAVAVPTGADVNGVLTLTYPAGGATDRTFTITGKGVGYFRRHAALMSGAELPWVASSGIRDCESISITPEIFRPVIAKPPRSKDDEEDELVAGAGKSGSSKKEEAASGTTPVAA